MNLDDFKKSYKKQEMLAKALKLLDEKNREKELSKLGDFKKVYLTIWGMKIK